MLFRSWLVGCFIDGLGDGQIDGWRGLDRTGIGTTAAGGRLGVVSVLPFL